MVLLETQVNPGCWSDFLFAVTRLSMITDYCFAWFYIHQCVSRMLIASHRAEDHQSFTAVCLCHLSHLKPFCFPSVFPDSFYSAQELALSSESQRPALLLPFFPNQVTLSFFPNSVHHLQSLLGLGNFRDLPAFSKVRNFPYCCFPQCSCSHRPTCRGIVCRAAQAASDK